MRTNPFQQLQTFLENKKADFRDDFHTIDKLMEKLDGFMKKPMLAKKSEPKSSSTVSTVHSMLHTYDSVERLTSSGQQPSGVIQEVDNDGGEITPKDGQVSLQYPGISSTPVPEKRRNLLQRQQTPRKHSAEDGRSKTRSNAANIDEDQNENDSFSLEKERVFQDLDPSLFPQSLLDSINYLPQQDLPSYYREVLMQIVQSRDSRLNQQPEPSEIEVDKRDPKKILRLSLYALLSAIFKKDSENINIRNMIILTYDNYTTASNVLLFLFMKLHSPAPLNLSAQEEKVFDLNYLRCFVKQRVCSTLNYWLKERIEDFVQEPKLLTLMKVVFDVGVEYETDEVIKTELKFYRRIYLERIEKLITTRKSSGKHPTRVFLSREEDHSADISKSSERKKTDEGGKSSFTSLFSSLFSSNIFKSTPFGRFIIDTPSLTIAEHCRHINFQVFKKIPISECFQRRWDKTQIRRKHAPQMAKIFNRTNNLAFWVSISIARQPDINYIIIVVKKMIEIAEEAKKLQDYETCFQICSRISQLNYLPCATAIWREIPMFVKGKLKEFERFFDHQSNYSKFNDLFLSSSPPCLPVFNYLLMKLRNLQQTPPVYISLHGQKLINFAVQKNFSDFLTKVRNFQGACVEVRDFNQNLCNYLEKNFMDEFEDLKIDTENFSNADEIVQKLLAKLNSSLA